MRRTTVRHQPLQPLFAGFLGSTSSVASSVAAFSSSTAPSTFSWASSTAALAFSSSALTALSFWPPQPLPAMGTFFTSALPVPVLPPQPPPLPDACAPGRVIPPMLSKPATPSPASIFFTSFFMSPSSHGDIPCPLAIPINMLYVIGYSYQKRQQMSIGDATPWDNLPDQKVCLQKSGKQVVCLP